MVHFAQLFGRHVVLGFKEIIEIIRVFMARKNPENSTPLIVDHYHPKGVWDIIVPQGIAIVKETQIARDKGRGFIVHGCTSNGCGGASVYPTSAPVTEHFQGFI
jgi:hypothetical protein